MRAPDAALPVIVLLRQRVQSLRCLWAAVRKITSGIDLHVRTECLCLQTTYLHHLKGRNTLKHAVMRGAAWGGGVSWKGRGRIVWDMSGINKGR